MPGFNLVRNSRVFFTTNVADATGVVAQGALTSAGTQELAIMNGFSFSQSTNSQTITVNEAGSTPTRGQRAFNSALNPVEFSFSTYIRPRGADATIDMDEKVLWNSLLSDGSVNLVPSGVSQANSFSVSALTISRTGSTNVITFTWASIDISTVPKFTTADIGTKVNVGGIINNSGLGFNGSGTIVSITGTPTTCTGMVVAMDIAPVGTGNPSTTTGTVYFSKSSAALRNPASSNEPAHVAINVGLSNKNQLQSFGLIVIIDQSTYIIDNCALSDADIDFGLDGIANIKWSGKGASLRTLSTAGGTAGTFSGSLIGTYTPAAGPAISAGNFITRKLSTASLSSTFRGLGTGAKAYNVALTGGTVKISNNINFVTPESLGVVNVPIGYYTGTRAISGNITAYLKTGASNTTAALLSDLLAATPETRYYLELQMGGINNSVKVELEFPAVTLHIPTIEVQDVVSTNISFVAQGACLIDSSTAANSDNGSNYYDVEAVTDMLVRYYSV